MESTKCKEPGRKQQRQHKNKRRQIVLKQVQNCTIAGYILNEL